VAQQAARLGLTDLVAHAERWRPWRAYAVQHLWALGDHAINRMPGGTP
jgi:AraC family transcriptional regulator of adaptative response / DNA-3-methyladenine glycosylase II